ncbi:hypothetical protein EDD36DRAFT_463742 [Exophiala viscosa]|uniref:BZIP domain-containing protein n=1 Tax=Exophiala viscosa TaxID=2486360 RepID=A0AAN6DYY9_9EURO|nr:hypothetical protein EDD36DRAFT_463742 [Exophiala viscosa]
MQGPYHLDTMWQTTLVDANASIRSANYLMGYDSWEIPGPSDAADLLGTSRSLHSDSMHVQEVLVKHSPRSEKRRAQNRKAQQMFRARKRQELDQVKETLRQKELSFKQLEAAYRKLYLICTALKQTEGRSSQSIATLDRLLLQEATKLVFSPRLQRNETGESDSSSSPSMDCSSSRPCSLTTQSSMSDDDGILSPKQTTYAFGDSL